MEKVLLSLKTGNGDIGVMVQVTDRITPVTYVHLTYFPHFLDLRDSTLIRPTERDGPFSITNSDVYTLGCLGDPRTFLRN